MVECGRSMATSKKLSFALVGGKRIDFDVY